MLRMSALRGASLICVFLLVDFAPPPVVAETLNLYLLITSGHQYVDGDVVPPYPGMGPQAGYTDGQVNELVHRQCVEEAKNTPPPSPPPKLNPKEKNAKRAPAPALAPVPTPCEPRRSQAVNALISSIMQNQGQRQDLDKAMYQYQVVQPPPPPMVVTIPPKPVYTDDDRADMCRIQDYNYHRMANMLFSEVNAWKNGYKGIDVFNSSWLAATQDPYPEQAALFAMQDVMLKDPHNTTGEQLRAVYETTWRQIIGMPDDSYCQANHIQGIG